MNALRGFHLVIDWKVVNLICKNFNFIWRTVNVIWKIINLIWNIIDLWQNCYITQEGWSDFHDLWFVGFRKFILLYILFGRIFLWYLGNVFSPNNIFWNSSAKSDFKEDWWSAYRERLCRFIVHSSTIQSMVLVCMFELSCESVRNSIWIDMSRTHFILN